MKCISTGEGLIAIVPTVLLLYLVNPNVHITFENNPLSFAIQFTLIYFFCFFMTYFIFALKRKKNKK